MVYERMASYVSERGGNIYLNTPVKRVINIGLRGERDRAYGRKDREHYDHIVSTMPLTLLVLGLEGVGEDVIASATVFEVPEHYSRLSECAGRKFVPRQLDLYSLAAAEGGEDH